MATTNILVAIPVYGGSIKVPCAMSLIKLSSYFISKRIAHTPKPIGMASVDTARNIFGSIMTQQKTFSHLLFIDSDMEFEPSDVARLLAAAKPVIGYAYPKRGLDLSALFKLAVNESYPTAVAKASQFSLYTAHHGPRTIENGICDVEGIGMGLALINREVFERMASTGKLRTTKTHHHQPHGLKGPIYGFFDTIKTDDLDCGEDISFCLRWRQLCAGKIWAIVDREIGHIGEFTYRANFLARYVSKR